MGSHWLPVDPLPHGLGLEISGVSRCGTPAAEIPLPKRERDSQLLFLTLFCSGLVSWGKRLGD